VIAGVLLLATLPAAFGESSYLPIGASGASVGGSVTFDGTELSHGTGGIFYSIGGLLDLGASMSYGPGTPGNWDTTDSNVSLRYNVMVLRQRPGVPINFELRGSFGATNSSGLAVNGVALRREGNGYSVAMRIFRDFNFASWMSLRFGIIGSYESYLYLTQLTATPDPDADPTGYPTSERIDRLQYGGLLGLTFRIDWTAISFGASVYTNPSFDLLVEPEFHIAVALPE
jgi:hypothetical protein